jgi:hypothetical protein
MAKEYIGDGVYIDHDGYHFVLTAENGMEVTNIIYIEPGVMNLMNAYAKRTYEEFKQQQGEKDGDVQKEPKADS